MQVTIDKYGRILIPKRLREQLGIQLEQQVELRLSESGASLEIVPPQPAVAEVVITESGWPVIYNGPPPAEVEDFDTVAFIKAEREAYLDKKMGWS
mgnify:CR=1 FL=1